MGENIIRRLEVKHLKGLNDVTITFSNSLTAIMGINGSGKTTILHALACVYKRERSGEEYQFSNFLVPNPDSRWSGSELTAVYWQGGINKGKRRLKRRRYYKNADRWAPSYSTRPRRDVFYIGIDTCLPEIERKRRNTYIFYTTRAMEDRISNKIIRKSAYVLDKDYSELLEHNIQKKDIYGVKLNNGLSYSALSMGTGEQRVIKILNTVFKAPDYSLILIDEMDLLLHVNAFKKLLHVINEEAIRKNIQIIFTTHSLMISEFDFISIQYIEQIPQRTFVYTSINTEMIYSMTGVEARAIKVYVEDSLAQALVKKIAKELNIWKKVEVHLFGSAENAFTLASSTILRNELKDNILIVLDGDVYIDKDSKLQQIKKCLSGTEKDIEEKWEQALLLISQFSLPKDYLNPEQFIHKLLSDPKNEQCELVQLASAIRNVDDKHSFIYDIVKRVGDNYDVVINDILSIISQTPEWQDYTQNIRKWLQARADV